MDSRFVTLFFFPVLNHPTNFEEPLEVVDLSSSHREEDEGFKKGPHHNSGKFGVLVDLSCGLSRGGSCSPARVSLFSWLQIAL